MITYARTLHCLADMLWTLSWDSLHQQRLLQEGRMLIGYHTNPT